MGPPSGTELTPLQFADPKAPLLTFATSAFTHVPNPALDPKVVPKGGNFFYGASGGVWSAQLP